MMSGSTPRWKRILWFITEETKTLPNTWKASLPLLLNQRRVKSNTTPRIAILGVGNLFRSEDAAGILVARALSNRECAADTDHILILEAGQAPENRTGELRKFAPELVLIVDAAEMGETPGAIRWISGEEIDGMSASTHSLPLSMLIHYLKLDIKCDVRLLGIQVGSNEVGENVSMEVLQAVDEIVYELDRSIRHLSSRL
jgi:hydrogenase 3 maturation protease